MIYIVSAIVELGAGVAFLFFPLLATTLLIGIPLETPAGMTVTRIGGVALLSLGIVCYFAQGDRGVIVAMSSYNVLTVAVIVLSNRFFKLLGGALWLVVVLHSVMAAWCIFYLT